MSAAPAGSGRGVGPRFPIRIHSSWLLLTAVLSALFAVIYFRADTGVSTVAAATMGVLTSALLFASVLVHELAHAVAARRQGLEVKRITLKVFGGNTELVRDPSDPASELRIALAGPVATLVLLVAFAVPGFAIDSVPAAARAVASNLALINALLLAFNLIPAIPLDGGRILRAVLWALWGKPAAATRAVTAAGRSFGFLFVAFGVLALFAGGATGEGARLVFGAGFVLIGLHLRGAAAHVARHLWIADSLHGVTADNLLDYRILTAERNATGHDLAAMGTRHADIPVVDDTRPGGRGSPRGSSWASDRDLGRSDGRGPDAHRHHRPDRGAHRRRDGAAPVVRRGASLHRGGG